MARICCLAGIDRAAVPKLGALLKAVGETRPAVRAALAVRELGDIRPDLLIADIDGLAVDALELLRQIRFVLPSCVIVVYSGDAHRAWGLACHNAGANAMLSKDSSKAELVEGLGDALASGCYTDPRFVA